MIRMVDTIHGPIHPNELGGTLIHEHIASTYSGWFIDATRYPFDTSAVIAGILRDMESMKACGINSLVDATVAELGRDIRLLEEISDKTDVNIIAATGFFTESAGSPAYFKYIDAMTGNGVKDVTELMEMEVTKGIEGTRIKAGVIKLATGFGTITPYEKMIFTGAARVQKTTGVPIITHTEKGTMGPEQADLLISEGADPKHIMIGHADSGDIKYYLNILKKGVFVGFDRWGLNDPVVSGGLDTIRLGCVIALIHMGYANQLMVGHDRGIFFISKPIPYDKSMFEHWDHTHFSKRIVPALKKAGVTDSQINSILVDNPRRFFGGE